MKKKGKEFKIVAVVVICLLLFFTAFDFWWSMPVSFLKRVGAQEIAYIEVRDGNTGKHFRVEAQDDIAHIVTNIQESRLYKDGVSLGYMGTAFTLHFYDQKGKCVEKLIVNYSNTIRKDPFFYRDRDSGLCFEYLCDLEAELAGTWEESGNQP